MPCPADVIGLDALSCLHSPAGRSPPKHLADSPNGVSLGGLINPGFFWSHKSLCISCCFGHLLRSWSNPMAGQNANPESSCTSNCGRWDRRGAPTPMGMWVPELAPACSRPQRTPGGLRDMTNVLLRCWNGAGGLNKVQHHEPVPGISHGCAFARELLEREAPSKIIWFLMCTLQFFLS